MKSNKYTEVSEKLGMDGVLMQLAEECGELVQACGKVYRARHDQTPVSLDEAFDALIEELADVSLMIDTTLDGICSFGHVKKYFTTYSEKQKRMFDRLGIKEEEA